MNILLVVVPRYGAYMMTSTGVMMLLANAIYYWLLPMKPLHIHIEAAELHFELGWCFWLVLVAGFICIFVGGAVSIIDLIYPHKFSTILEMDYGTPFDRHTIIKDSQTTKETKKNVPKKLEEPPTWNGLWRRLSKRDGHREGDESHPSGRGHRRDGEVNYAYDHDAPKSPWRYPHLSLRGDSRKHKSVSFKKKAQVRTLTLQF
jgi:dual oxidase maturation factor 1